MVRAPEYEPNLRPKAARRIGFAGRTTDGSFVYCEHVDGWGKRSQCAGARRHSDWTAVKYPARGPMQPPDQASSSVSVPLVAVDLHGPDRASESFQRGSLTDFRQRRWKLFLRIRRGPISLGGVAMLVGRCRAC